MDFISEEKLLLLELQTLMNETMKRCDSVFGDDEDDHHPRRTFALAQVVGARDLMKYLAENEEWVDFGGVLETMLENEESRYLDAWSADDRQLMTITLANRRLLKRLMRRLTDPRRRQSLLSQVMPQP
jgi:hypothetical protein